jgi:hypothetical protein
MSNAADMTQRFLLLADVHFDSPHCDRRLLKSYLEQAKREGAGVFCFGDFYDAMQGRDDRRSDKSDLLPQNKSGKYINTLIDDAADFLMPYAGNIVFLSMGNHESAILRHLEVDILLLLAGRLGVCKMGYAGFVRFLFSRGPKSAGATRRVLYFHHGAGGGGEVTKGVIQAQRRQAKVVADIYVSGHIHEAWSLWSERTELSNAGDPITPPLLHVCIPTMKDEYELEGGYHIEKDRPPKPQGAYWLEFRHDCGEHGRVTFDVARA